MRFCREGVVWSVVSGLCQRDGTEQDHSLAGCRGCDEGNVAAIGVADVRHTIVCSFSLDSFGTSGVVTKNDLDVIVVEDFETIGKNGLRTVSAIAVFGCGAANCHASLLRSLIPQLSTYGKLTWRQEKLTAVLFFHPALKPLCVAGI